MSLTIVPSVENIIRRIASELGVDPNLAVATARQESGLQVGAVGDQGCSVGLFQLNTCGGLGVGLSEAQLRDPEINARVALTNFARVQAANPEIQGGWLAATAQRPANPEAYAAKIDALLAAMGESSGTAAPVGPAGPSRPTSATQPRPGQAGGGGAGGTSSGGGLVNVTVPGFEQVGSFFDNLSGLFKPQNWWRAAFIVGGVVLVWVGGRMYLRQPTLAGGDVDEQARHLEHAELGAA